MSGPTIALVAGLSTYFVAGWIGWSLGRPSMRKRALHFERLQLAQEMAQDTVLANAADELETLKEFRSLGVGKIIHRISLAIIR